MSLIIDGYRPAVIAESLGITRQNVSDDVKWLKKKGYINPDFSMRRRFKPTAETIHLIVEMLRARTIIL